MKVQTIKFLARFLSLFSDEFLQKIVNLIQSARGIGAGSILSFEETGESKLIAQVAVKMSAQSIVLDIGAHEGKFIECIRRYSDAVIHAFEPTKYNYGKLVCRYSTESNIFLNNFALGDSSKSVLMWSNFLGTSSASIYKEGLKHFDTRMDEVIMEKVEMRNLMSYLIDNHIEEVFFMKIDVEGAEFMILDSIKDLLGERRVKIVQFEFGHFHIPARVFFKEFWNLFEDNYLMYRVSLSGLVHIPKYSYELEVFRGATNIVCVAKSYESLVKSLVR